MLLLDRPANIDLQGRAVVRPVCLRVRPDGPVVDLPHGKTSVGSSPRCNIRIQQPGVQPLHCLILHDERGLSVRRWAGETFLNGQRLEESSIGPGDCLRVGPVELEVVQPQSETLTPELTTAEVTAATDSGQIRMGVDLARARSRKLLAALRRNRSSHHELSQRVADLDQQINLASAERESISSELQKAIAELTDARQQVLDNDALVVARRELAVRNEELGHEVSELAHRVDQLTQEQMASAAARQALMDEKSALADEVRRLADEICDLRNQGSQLNDQHSALSGERDDLRRQQEQLQSDLQGLEVQKSRLADDQAALCGERDDLRRQTEQLQANLQALAEEKATLADKQSGLIGECERLRQESDGVADIKRQLREAVADRENTSSELHRALLQLAEMQERDGHNAALAAAQQALKDELEKSQQEIAALQGQVDRLSQDRTAADETRLALAQQTSELGETLQRLTDEKAALVAELADVREQLESAQRQDAEFCAVLLTQSSESTRQLEDQLAAARMLESKFANDCDQWERDRAEGAQREAEQSRRIAELESQLAEAQATASQAVQQPTNSISAIDHAGPAEGSADFSSGFGTSSAEAPREFDWSSVRGNSSAFEAPKYPSDADPFGMTSELSAPDATWVRTSEDVNWSPATGGAPGTTDGNHWGLPSVTDDASAEAAPACQSQPPFDSQAETSRGEPTADLSSAALQNDPSDNLNERPASPALEATSQSGPKPFIERYSHMFAEDSAANDAPPRSSGRKPDEEEAAFRKPRAMNTPRSSANPATASGDDDEESIEQYMAKLLQRVRGDTSGPPASQAPPRVLPMSAPIDYDPTPLQTMLTDVTTLSEPRRLQSPGAVDLESISSFKPSKRNVTLPAPQTDLEALRALANESARRAISRHALRKHQRNAITKVIVSTLAGVTSLWLMLQSPNWRDLQFLSACVAMMVAAYWAGETIRTLLETLRVATHDDTDDEIEELSAQLRSPLPIDLDTDRKW